MASGCWRSERLPQSQGHKTTNAGRPLERGRPLPPGQHRHRSARKADKGVSSGVLVAFRAEEQGVTQGAC